MKRIEEAKKAYIEALLQPRKEDEDSFCPPPVSTIRDKHWTRYLREHWPDFHSIKLDRHKTKDGYTSWLKNNVKNFYWYTSNGDVFVFSNKEDAVMFKLKWG